MAFNDQRPVLRHRSVFGGGVISMCERCRTECSGTEKRGSRWILRTAICYAISKVFRALWQQWGKAERPFGPLWQHWGKPRQPFRTHCRHPAIASALAAPRQARAINSNALVALRQAWTIISNALAARAKPISYLDHHVSSSQ